METPHPMNPQTQRRHPGTWDPLRGLGALSAFRLLHACPAHTERDEETAGPDAQMLLAAHKAVCRMTRKSKKLESHLNVCWRSRSMSHTVLRTLGGEEDIIMLKGYGRLLKRY